MSINRQRMPWSTEKPEEDDADARGVSGVQGIMPWRRHYRSYGAIKTAAVGEEARLRNNLVPCPP